MPLFRHSPSPVREPEPKSGLFHKRSSSVSTPATTNSSHSSRSGSGFLGMGGSKDPSIAAAKERVKAAEQSERMADEALVAARKAVLEAREHVKRVEAEAAEGARLAKLRQQEAAGISKSARGLGKYNS